MADPTQRSLSRSWLLPLLVATLGLVLLWAYAARPVEHVVEPAAAEVTSTGKASVTSSAAPSLKPGTPLQLALMQQHVAAPVIRSGLNADGSMAIPEDPGVIGWYSAGARPGASKGSMVMAGHINSRRTGAGVLSALTEAKVGQLIVVRVADGRGFAYRISRIQQFHKRGLPLAEVFASDGPHRLTLLTCSGRFLGRGLGYEDNLVVTATPVRG